MNSFLFLFREAVQRSLLLFVMAIFLVVAGCDSLDVTDPNAPNADDVTVQSLISGVEGSMRAEIGIYLRVSGIMAREAYYFEPADPRYTGELYTGPLDPGGFLVTRPWNARYRTIAQALIVQGRASGDAGINGYTKTIIGHQLLLNLGYMDENGLKIQFSEDVSTPFVSKAEAMNEIIRYLDEGFSDLNGAGDSFSFSLSSGFAGFDTPATFAQFNRAIRARVAAYAGDYGTVMSALGASFLDAGGDMNTGAYYVFSAGAGDRLNPMFEEPTAASVKLRAHPDFKAQAEAGDTRFSTKVLDRTDDAGFDPSPSSANGLVSGLVATTAKGSAGPYPIIRNEELLLLRAEAHIAQGNMGDAEADINAVRAAAGLDPVTLDAGTAMDQLIHERFYSLFLEGHRWIDARRFGFLNQLPQDMVGDPASPSTIFPMMPRPNDEVPG